MLYTWPRKLLFYPLDKVHIWLFPYLRYHQVFEIQAWEPRSPPSTSFKSHTKEITILPGELPWEARLGETISLGQFAPPWLLSHTLRLWDCVGTRWPQLWKSLHPGHLWRALSLNANSMWAQHPLSERCDSKRVRPVRDLLGIHTPSYFGLYSFVKKQYIYQLSSRPIFLLHQIKMKDPKWYCDVFLKKKQN